MKVDTTGTVKVAHIVKWWLTNFDRESDDGRSKTLKMIKLSLDNPENTKQFLMFLVSFILTVPLDEFDEFCLWHFCIYSVIQICVFCTFT